MSLSRQSLPAAAIVAALFVAVPFMGSTAPGPTVIFVDDDAPLSGDGLSWDSAYRFLQDALANAAGVSEIRVAQGTYKPDQDEAGNVTPGDREGTFQLINGVALRGGFVGLDGPDPDERNIELFETILSGDLLGNDGPDFENNEDNSFHVLVVQPTSTAVVSGFMVTGGNAQSDSFPDSGGGLFIDGATLTVTQCTFRGNSVDNNGGAMFIDDSIVTLTQCRFVENRTLAGPGRGGGGITTFDSEVLLVACEFLGNSSTNIAAGMASAAFGGSSSQVTLIDCVFAGNTADLAGGGLLMQAVDVMLVGCTITDNAATDPTAFGFGGGIHMNSGVLLAVNSIVVANFAQKRGGGVFGEDEVTLINCTISENSAGESGGGIDLDFGTNAMVENSIFWANTVAGVMDEPAQIHREFGAVVSLEYSNVQGLTGDLGGTGNIDADPLFVDPDNGDFRLSPGSPCIDAADNTAVPLEITTDLDGNPRFVDDPATLDTGNGEPPIVDMGAYEFQLPCPGDLNGDDVVSVPDLLLLLGDFGTCDGSPADFDGDGCVGVPDLLALIANFGPCPGAPCVWDVNGDGVVDQSDLQQILDNFGPCDGCPEDVNGDGIVNGQDAAAVATHFGPCP